MEKISPKTRGKSQWEVNKLNRWSSKFLAATVVIAGILMIQPTTSLAQHDARPERGNPRLDQRLPSPLNDQSVSARLTVAARAFGVETQPEHTAYASGNGISAVAAPVAGIEDVPATALPDGVPGIFAYVEAPEHPELPNAGYYLVRITASEETVERVFQLTGGEETAAPREGNASMELINA